MSTYIVRTTLFQIDGAIEKPIAGSEHEETREITEAVEEFLEDSGDVDGEIEEYLLCEVPELDDSDEMEEDDEIDVDAEEVEP